MPLMPFPLGSKGEPRPVPMPNDYHSFAFQYLLNEYPDQIRSALIQTGLDFRRDHLRQRMRREQPSDHFQSWDLLRPYLDELEGAISQIVRRHSRAYWFHLYRRMAPVLSSDHDGKTDPLTAILVRKIADQAFVRYGSSRDDDLVPISKTTPESLLGGYFAKSIAAVGSAAPKTLFDHFSRNQRWVMGSFELHDFLEIHRLESLFYEYWRTMATLRKIGKGVVGTWNDEYNWFDYDQGVLPELFDRYDEETFGPGGVQTLLGTWHPQQNRSDDGLFFAWAQYNSKNVYKSPKSGARNFEVGLESLTHFWDTNGFLAEPFYQVHGVRLDALMYLLCALSASAVIPVRLIDSRAGEEEAEAVFKANMMNLEFRAYVLRTSARGVIIGEAVALASILDEGRETPSEDDIQTAFDFLCYADGKDKTVSLWAGGRKYPIVPYGDNHLFDLSAVPDWIEGLFFGVRDGVADKGFNFEEVFRQYLRSNEIDVIHNGNIVWEDGSAREADAVVRVGEIAIIAECVAAERPVDYEITEPRRFAKRKDILEAKADQARSLAEKFQETPSARNLDLSWASDIRWIVVSHLPEFLWTNEFPCYADGRQCIMHPISAANWMTRLAQQAEDN